MHSRAVTDDGTSVRKIQKGCSARESETTKAVNYILYCHTA